MLPDELTPEEYEACRVVGTRLWHATGVRTALGLFVQSSFWSGHEELRTALQRRRNGVCLDEIADLADALLDEPEQTT